MIDLTRTVVALALLVAAGAASAQVACPAGTTRVARDALADTVRNKTMCAARGGENWQEFHRMGGALIDYKMGPNDRVDPSKEVGTWEVGMLPAGLLRHNYTGGGSYAWALCGHGGGVYTLVSANGSGSLGNVRLVDGNFGCNNGTVRGRPVR